MENNTPNPLPTTPPPVTPPPFPPVQQVEMKKEGKGGMIIGLIVLIILVVLAGLYFFGNSMNVETVPQDSTAAVSTTTLTSETPVSEVSTEDEDLASMSSDLDAQLEDVDYSF